jgi:hypothetical protein
MALNLGWSIEEKNLGFVSVAIQRKFGGCSKWN